jgi:hypothetical protein
MFSVETVGEKQSVQISSRIGMIRSSVNVGNGPVTLMNYLLPGTKGQELISVDWYPLPKQSRAQLTVMRVRTEESRAAVVDRYARTLESGFSRKDGWPQPGSTDQERWTRMVREASDPSATVFREELSRRSRGILVQEVPGPGSVDVTLYDYQR